MKFTAHNKTRLILALSFSFLFIIVAGFSVAEAAESSVTFTVE